MQEFFSCVLFPPHFYLSISTANQCFHTVTTSRHPQNLHILNEKRYMVLSNENCSYYVPPISSAHHPHHLLPARQTPLSTENLCATPTPHGNMSHTRAPSPRAAFLTGTPFLPTGTSARARAVCRTRRVASPVAQASASAAASSPFDDTSVNSTPPPSPPPTPVWTVAGECDLLLPPSDPPRVLLLFVGGLGAGTSAPLFYSNLLSALSTVTSGAVLAGRLPVLPSTDHLSVSRQLQASFAQAIEQEAVLQDIPIIAIGHSLGARLLLLGENDEEDDENGIQVDKRRQIEIKAVVALAISNATAPANMGPMLTRLPDVVEAASERVQAGLQAFAEGLRGEGVDKAASGSGDEVARRAREVFGKVAEKMRDATSEMEPSREDSLKRFARLNELLLVVRFTRDSLDDGLAVVRAVREGNGKAKVVERIVEGTHMTAMTPRLDGREMRDDVPGAQQWGETAKEMADGVQEEMQRLVEVVAAFVKLASGS